MPTPSLLIDTWEDLPGLRNDWNRLWRLTPGVMNELYSFDWIATIAEASIRARGGTPFCLAVGREDRVEGIAPLFRFPSEGGRFRVRCETVGFLPSPFVVRHGILSSAEDLGFLSEEFVRRLARLGVDQVVLSGLGPETAPLQTDAFVSAGVRCTLLQTNQEKGGMPGTASGDACAVEIRGTWEEYLQLRSHKLRRNLKKRNGQLAQAGEVEFRHYSRGAFVSGNPMPLEILLDSLVAIDRKAWKATQGLHLSGHGRGFLDALVACAEEHRALDLSFLHLDGRPVAFRFGWAINRRFRSMSTAYDPEFSQISPGFLLCALHLRSCHENTDYLSVEYGGSRHLQKHQFATFKDSSFTLYLHGPTLKGRGLHFYRRHLGNWHMVPGRRGFGASIPVNEEGASTNEWEKTTDAPNPSVRPPTGGNAIPLGGKSQ